MLSLRLFVEIPLTMTVPPWLDWILHRSDIYQVVGVLLLPPDPYASHLPDPGAITNYFSNASQQNSPILGLWTLRPYFQPRTDDGVLMGV